MVAAACIAALRDSLSVFHGGARGEQNAVNALVKTWPPGAVFEIRPIL
jgi:hypothetical protein